MTESEIGYWGRSGAVSGSDGGEPGTVAGYHFAPNYGMKLTNSFVRDVAKERVQVPKKTDKRPAQLVSLPEQELAKVKPLSEDSIRAALEKGKQDRDAAADSVQQVNIENRSLFN